MSDKMFGSLCDVAYQLRDLLEQKRYVLIYAHNGTGKTRLSTDFKDIGKPLLPGPIVALEGKKLMTETAEWVDAEDNHGDTLYFNAFTEDLFTWDNDLENDWERRLMMNRGSTFFDGLSSLEMDVKIGQQLERYADFNFYINYEESFVTFFRERDKDNNPIPIKVSRGEENIFIWSFFLAILQIVIDNDEGNPYHWVKYVYIDDPISSLDEHNAVKVAHDLTNMLTSSREDLRVVISTHHVLFYNVVANQLRKKASRWYLNQGADPGTYRLESLGSVPPFHHLSTLIELSKVGESGELNTQHFNMLRRVLEQTAAFFGYESWDECLKPKAGESEKAFQKRLLDLSSHGDCLIFQSSKIDEKMSAQFRLIFEQFRNTFPFNNKLFCSNET